MINDFFLTEWFFDLLRWLYSVLGNNYFLTIFIVTLALRIIQILPDINNRKNQRKQAKIQPEIEKLKKKYADNPQKLSMEQNKLMRENGIGMLSSCLPLLLTLPLFFCFLAAFRFWGYEQTVRLTYETIVDEEKAQETFDSYSFLWITNIWQPDSGMQPVITSAEMLFTNSNIHRLFYFTEHPEAFELFKELGFFVESTAKGSYNGVVIAELTDELIAKYDAIVKPCVDLYAGYNNGWFVLPLLCGGTTLLSAWLMQRGQAQPAGNAASTGKMMMYLMPIMTFVFSLSTNASFALYWTVSNVISMITTYFINKSIGIGPAAAKEVSKT